MNKTITVKQLIAKLKKMPQDALIFSRPFGTDEPEYTVVSTVQLEKNMTVTDNGIYLIVNDPERGYDSDDEAAEIIYKGDIVSLFH